MQLTPRQRLATSVALRAAWVAALLIVCCEAQGFAMVREVGRKLPVRHILDCSDVDDMTSIARGARQSFDHALFTVSSCGFHFGEVESQAVYPKEFWIILFSPPGVTPAVDYAEWNVSSVAVGQHVVPAGENVPEQALEGLSASDIARRHTAPSPDGTGPDWVRHAVRISLQFFAQLAHSGTRPERHTFQSQRVLIHVDGRRLNFKLTAHVHVNTPGFQPITVTQDARALELLPGQVHTYNLYVDNPLDHPVELGTVSRNDNVYTLVMIDPSAYSSSNTDGATSPFVVAPMTRSALLASFHFGGNTETHDAGHIQVTFVKGPLYRLFYNVSIKANKAPKLNLGVLRSSKQRLDAPVFFTNPSDTPLSVRDAFIMMPNVSMSVSPPRNVLFATVPRDVSFEHNSEWSATLARCITVTPLFGRLLLPGVRTQAATVTLLGEPCLAVAAGVAPALGLRRIIGPLGLRLNSSAPPRLPDKTFEYKFAVDVVVGDITLRQSEGAVTGEVSALFAPRYTAPAPRSPFSNSPVSRLVATRLPVELDVDLPTAPRVSTKHVSTSVPWFAVLPPAERADRPRPVGGFSLGEVAVDSARIPVHRTNTGEELQHTTTRGSLTASLGVQMPGGGTAQVQWDQALVVAQRPFLPVEQATAPPEDFDSIVDAQYTGGSVSPAQRQMPFSEAWPSAATREIASSAHPDARLKLQLHGVRPVNGVHLGIIEDNVVAKAPKTRGPPVRPPKQRPGDVSVAGASNRTVHFINTHNFSIAVYGLWLTSEVASGLSHNGHGLTIHLINSATGKLTQLGNEPKATTNGPLRVVPPGGSFAIFVKHMRTSASSAVFGLFSGSIHIDALIERTANGAMQFIRAPPSGARDAAAKMSGFTWFGMEVPVTYGFAPSGSGIYFTADSQTTFPWARRVSDEQGRRVYVENNISVRSTLPFDVPVTSVYTEVLPGSFPPGKFDVSAVMASAAATAVPKLHDAFQVELKRLSIPANSTVPLASVRFFPAFLPLVHRSAPRDGSAADIAAVASPQHPVLPSVLSWNPLLGVPKAEDVEDDRSTSTGRSTIHHPIPGTPDVASVAALVPVPKDSALFRPIVETQRFKATLPKYDTSPDRVIAEWELSSWQQRLAAATQLERGAFVVTNGGSRWATMVAAEPGFSRLAVGFSSNPLSTGAETHVPDATNTFAPLAAALGLDRLDLVMVPLHSEAEVHFGVLRGTKQPTSGRVGATAGHRSATAVPTATKRYVVISNPGMAPVTVQAIVVADATDDKGRPLSHDLRANLKDNAERYWDYVSLATGKLRGLTELGADDAWFSDRADLFFASPEARRPILVHGRSTASIGPFFVSPDACSKVPPGPGEQDDQPRSLHAVLLLRNNETVFEPIRLRVTCGGAPVVLHPPGNDVHETQLMVLGRRDLLPPAPQLSIVISPAAVASVTKDRGVRDVPSLQILWTHLTRPFEAMGADGQARASWSDVLNARLTSGMYEADGSIALRKHGAAAQLGPLKFDTAVILRNPAGVPVVITDLRVNGAGCGGAPIDVQQSQEPPAPAGGVLIAGSCVGAPSAAVLDATPRPSGTVVALERRALYSAVVLDVGQALLLTIHALPDFTMHSAMTGFITVRQYFLPPGVAPRDAGAQIVSVREMTTQTFPVRISFPAGTLDALRETEALTAWDALYWHASNGALMVALAALVGFAAAAFARCSMRSNVSRDEGAVKRKPHQQTPATVSNAVASTDAGTKLTTNPKQSKESPALPSGTRAAAQSTVTTTKAAAKITAKGTQMSSSTGSVANKNPATPASGQTPSASRPTTPLPKTDSFSASPQKDVADDGADVTERPALGTSTAAIDPSVPSAEDNSQGRTREPPQSISNEKPLSLIPSAAATPTPVAADSKSIQSILSTPISPPVARTAAATAVAASPGSSDNTAGSSPAPARSPASDGTVTAAAAAAAIVGTIHIPKTGRAAAHEPAPPAPRSAPAVRGTSASVTPAPQPQGLAPGVVGSQHQQPPLPRSTNRVSAPASASSRTQGVPANPASASQPQQGSQRHGTAAGVARDAAAAGPAAGRGAGGTRSHVAVSHAAPVPVTAAAPLQTPVPAALASTAAPLPSGTFVVSSGPTGTGSHAVPTNVQSVVYTFPGAPRSTSPPRSMQAKQVSSPATASPPAQPALAPQQPSHTGRTRQAADGDRLVGLFAARMQQPPGPSVPQPVVPKPQVTVGTGGRFGVVPQPQVSLPATTASLMPTHQAPPALPQYTLAPQTHLPGAPVAAGLQRDAVPAQPAVISTGSTPSMAASVDGAQLQRLLDGLRPGLPTAPMNPSMTIGPRGARTLAERLDEETPTPLPGAGTPGTLFGTAGPAPDASVTGGVFSSLGSLNSRQNTLGPQEFEFDFLRGASAGQPGFLDGILGNTQFDE